LELITLIKIILASLRLGENEGFLEKMVYFCARIFQKLKINLMKIYLFTLAICWIPFIAPAQKLALEVYTKAN
jgi:hypothetical protein